VGICTITDGSEILSASLKRSDYPMAIVDFCFTVPQKTKHCCRLTRKSLKLAVIVQEESELWIFVIGSHCIHVEMNCFYLQLYLVLASVNTILWCCGDSG
jgi:hypothetical protein